MGLRKAWCDVVDDGVFDNRDASLLLDRTRRDSLARIRDESIESFCYLYNMEYQRGNDTEKRLREERGLPPLEVGDRIADGMIEWGIDILGLSPAGSGFRSKQVENVLRSHEQDFGVNDAKVDTRGRGLRNRK
jgi:hypothetical protein